VNERWQKKFTTDEKTQVCLYITEWSDAFESSSCTKNNRGSFWIKTITICPPPSQLHKLTYTYPIAIGKDGDDHSQIKKKFAAELKVFVYLDLLASLQDQPEWRNSTALCWVVVHFLHVGGIPWI
jgi:hypothetical protein